jgi:CRP-like cAMP-binding protein
MNDVAVILQQTFPGLEGDGLEHLEAVARHRFYPPDATVVREEEVGQTFFIIVEGEVEVTKQVEGQTERVLQRHGPGDFFGEMALIETLPRTATARTVTPSTLLEFSKDDFDAVLSQQPAMALSVMRTLTHRLRQAYQRAIAELSQKNEELTRAISIRIPYHRGSRIANASHLGQRLSNVGRKWEDGWRSGPKCGHPSLAEREAGGEIGQ